MKKTVLVTGGAGYIGSHTTVELIEAGYRVVMADDLSNSELGAVRGVNRIVGARVPFVRVDCSDAGLLRRKVFKRFRIDAVIHFAAFKAVGESVVDPLKYFRNNFDTLITVLRLMREFGVRNLVFSSSATVYGQPESLPATEATQRQRAGSPYGYTKQVCEDMIADSVRAYYAEMGLRAISLRYFNPIGAHPSAQIGELPRGVPANLVPFITQTAAGVRPELCIFGDDYNTPDGTALRDYIDVVDLARAHVAAVNRMLAASKKEGEEDGAGTGVGGGMVENYEVFNVGTGVPVSVLELVKRFEAASGVRVPYRLVGRRAGDVEQIWAATQRANAELGWCAERSLDDTLRAAWGWEKRLRGL